MSPLPSTVYETFYALYYCNASGKGSNPELEANPTNKSPASQHVYLNILATNLSGEKETDLRCFLQKRIQLKDIVLEGGAKAALLDVGTRGSIMCVYQLFAKLQSGIAGGQGYCLALLAPDDGTLDLFLNEVEAFMRRHANKLTNAEKCLPDETRNSLKDWHRQSTLFIGHVLRALGERTAVLLHLALSGGTLDIEQVIDTQLRSDLSMFMSCCGLHELRRVVKINATLPKVIVARQDEESGRIELSLEECSQDSLQWCRRLLQESPDDPVVLRRIIEGYKIRTIQDMNLVRRIVRKAESDHYALYRAYKLLKECGYTKTLLGLSMSEHNFSSNNSLDNTEGNSNGHNHGGEGSFGGSSRGSTSSSSSSGSNGSVGQEIMGEDVISILLEHLPEDRYQTFAEAAPAPSTTLRQIRANS